MIVKKPKPNLKNTLKKEPKKNAKQDLTEKEIRSKRGRKSKRKGANFERELAKIFKEKYGVELTRTPQSGGFAKKSKKADEFRGDVVCLDESIEMMLHIEAKNQKTYKVKDWLSQAEEDCPKDKIPCVIFHKPNSSTNYAILNLNDLLNLVDKEKIFKEKK